MARMPTLRVIATMNVRDPPYLPAATSEQGKAEDLQNSLVKLNTGAAG
jgi:hypothetical protein